MRRVRAELALEPGTGTWTGTGTGIGTDDERDDERDGPYRTSQSVDGDARESRRGDAEMETERRAAGGGDLTHGEIGGDVDDIARDAIARLATGGARRRVPRGEMRTRRAWKPNRQQSY